MPSKTFYHLTAPDMPVMQPFTRDAIFCSCSSVAVAVAVAACIAMVASGSAPNFVQGCSLEVQRVLSEPESIEEYEELIQKALAAAAHSNPRREITRLGLRDLDPYGFSKALVNAYTVALAKLMPHHQVNSCSPGFIATDMTKVFGDPAANGMKTPEEGAITPVWIATSPECTSTGWYYGSDRKRSPLFRYRSPGSAPYDP
eukprot:g22100.t1